jgi:hypothetical protein
VKSPPLRLERLEDRTTPSTTTVSFVPDGALVGTQQSTLYHDLSAISPAVWQQQLLGQLQTLAGTTTTLALVPDDGASMNAPAPQDGAIRVAAVDELFTTDGSIVYPSPGYAFEVVGGAVTFGTGIGLTGPNGTPLSPAPQTPNNPPASLFPLILPLQKAEGSLYPTSPTSPTPTPTPTPPTSPTSPTPTSPSYSYPTSSTTSMTTSFYTTTTTTTTTTTDSTFSDPLATSTL